MDKNNFKNHKKYKKHTKIPYGNIVHYLGNNDLDKDDIDSYIKKYDEVYYSDGFFNGLSCGYVIYDKNNDLYKKMIFLKNKFTSNECEYLGVLDICMNCGKNTVIFTDSKLVEGQTTKHWKVNYRHLEFYVNIIKNLIKEKNIKIKWIQREYNIAGLAIEDGIINKI